MKLLALASILLLLAAAIFSMSGKPLATGSVTVRGAGLASPASIDPFDLMLRASLTLPVEDRHGE